MAAKNTTSVVAERKVCLVLDIEIDDTKNAMGREQGSDGVDDRIVVRLHKT
jgi:hypothetical protein